MIESPHRKETHRTLFTAICLRLWSTAYRSSHTLGLADDEKHSDVFNLFVPLAYKITSSADTDEGLLFINSGYQKFNGFASTGLGCSPDDSRRGVQWIPFFHNLPTSFLEAQGEDEMAIYLIDTVATTYAEMTCYVCNAVL